MQKKNPPPKPKSADEAAQTIQKAYLKYRSHYTRKDKLLSQATITSEEVKLPIFFKKSGAAALFPSKDKLNLTMLKRAILNGEDIRQWVLEAFFKKQITKHSVISFFQLQQFMNEFWHDKEKLKSLPTPPLQMFAIHAEGKLSAEAEAILIPHLTSMAPPITKKDPGKFKKALQENLAQLSAHEKYFSSIAIPQNSAYLLAYYLLSLNAKMTGNIEKHQQDFFESIAKSLGIRFAVDFDAENLDYTKSLKDKLEAEIFKDMSDEQKNLLKGDHDKLEDYINTKIATLFGVVAQDVTTNEFMPQYNPETKQFSLLVLSSETQNALYKSIIGKDPEDILKKTPMTATIGGQIYFELLQKNELPIGLTYPALPIPEHVHQVNPLPYGYTAHDESFHYPALLFLKAFAEPLYDLHLKFVNAIRETTGLELPGAVVNILDFGNDYFFQSFTGDESAADILKQTYPFEDSSSNKTPALKEYAAIIAINIIKNGDEYTEVLQKLLDASPEGNEDLEDLGHLLLENLRLENAEFFLDDEHDIPEKLREYSDSLGTFMYLLSRESQYTTEEIIELCDKLHTLEQSDKVKFKWNKQDGIMLNI